MAIRLQQAEYLEADARRVSECRSGLSSCRPAVAPMLRILQPRQSSEQKGEDLRLALTHGHGHYAQQLTRTLDGKPWRKSASLDRPRSFLLIRDVEQQRHKDLCEDTGGENSAKEEVTDHRHVGQGPVLSLHAHLELLLSALARPTAAAPQLSIAAKLQKPLKLRLAQLHHVGCKSRLLYVGRTIGAFHGSGSEGRVGVIHLHNGAAVQDQVPRISKRFVEDGLRNGGQLLGSCGAQLTQLCHNRGLVAR
mmetsp:Transcript_263/g.583  ORF Transcript_263/g.583 Transcript_263/m.583 type:complete len:250 (+) Transcript_263:123-872(+)